MTPEKQRLKLAEWAGQLLTQRKWRFWYILRNSQSSERICSKECASEAEAVQEADKILSGIDCIISLPEWYDKDETPDYLNDLNLVHGLEEKLDDSLWKKYEKRLCIVCNKVTEQGGTIFLEIGGCINATAPQRCEALLKCLGLWEEEE